MNSSVLFEIEKKIGWVREGIMAIHRGEISLNILNFLMNDNLYLFLVCPLVLPYAFFLRIQDEATSVVFGMPHEAIKRGGVDRILPLDKISEEVVRLCELEDETLSMANIN